MSRKCLFTGRDERFASSENHPGQLWSQHSLLFSGHQGPFLPWGEAAGCETQLSPTLA